MPAMSMSSIAWSVSKTRGGAACMSSLYVGHVAVGLLPAAIKAGEIRSCAARWKMAAYRQKRAAVHQPVLAISRGNVTSPACETYRLTTLSVLTSTELGAAMLAACTPGAQSRRC